MSSIRKRNQQRSRRRLRIKAQVSIVSDVPRVSVFRSLKNMYGQVIDDQVGKTLVSCSTLELSDLSGDKKAQAHAVGQELARRMIQNGIKKARLDRGISLYHGRVQAFAQGLREAGLEV